MKKPFAVTLTVLALALFTANCDILDPPRWGAMEVTVADQDSQPVAGAAVARWDANQVKRGGETNAQGVWSDPNVRKGHYRVEAAGATPETCYVKGGETAQCRLVVER